MIPADPAKTIVDLNNLLESPGWRELILPAIQERLEMFQRVPIEGYTLDQIAIATVSREAMRQWLEWVMNMPGVMIRECRKKIEEKHDEDDGL